MKKNMLWKFLIFTLFLFPGCGDDDGTSPEPPKPGKITAIVNHIMDRQGDYLWIAVYDSAVNWEPGASNEDVISSTIANIASDDFSFSHVMQEIDTMSVETGVEKSFDPATYSVVFFVAKSGSPPDRYTEVRASVNGDIDVNAPDWKNW